MAGGTGKNDTRQPVHDLPATQVPPVEKLSGLSAAFTSIMAEPISLLLYSLSSGFGAEGQLPMRLASRFAGSNRRCSRCRVEACSSMPRARVR